MGEKSSQIERQIEWERGELGEHLNELQSKVQEVTDWRVQFQKRPLVMMGVALGGGVLLAAMTGKRSRSRRHYTEDRADSSSEHRRGTELQKSKALETFDNIKGAMIGVAASTFQDFLGQMIPGFKTQLDKTVHEKRSGSLSSTGPSSQAAALGA
jgi:hypothetical protein